MERSPYKPFGFIYTYQGRRFAFDVLAETREQAEARAAAMSDAQCIGELCPQDHTTSDSMCLASI